MDVEVPGGGSRNVQTTLSITGCGVSGAYAPDPVKEEDEKEEEEEEEEEEDDEE